jgi:hypothetical protein
MPPNRSLGSRTKTTNCKDFDTCPKIKTILDKDMLDFQYIECINRVCASCRNSGTANPEVEEQAKYEESISFSLNNV